MASASLLLREEVAYGKRNFLRRSTAEPVIAVSYLQTARDLYREAAQKPAENLCCISTAGRNLPGFNPPEVMQQMNYGCGSTVRPESLKQGDTALYIGVGGGLEALELAYYTRAPGGVVAVDPVPEMRKAAEQNLAIAARTNDWFDPSFVEIRDGDALNLPVDDGQFDYVAQNCLFNIFHEEHLHRALTEARRALASGGRLAMSDPITPVPLPAHLTGDERLRAMCLSGCQSLESYLQAICEAGFGAIEVWARRPYRALSAEEFRLDHPVMLESIDVVAINVPMPDDGPCVFTGRTATYLGTQQHFDDQAGHVLPKGLPQQVCDKTAKALATLEREDLLITDSTWHYGGGGCC